MARTTLTAQKIVRTGLVPTLVTPDASGAILPAGTILVVKNGSGSSINVTVETPETRAGLAVTDQVVAVAAGATEYIGNFPASTFVRPLGGSDPGVIYVDFSSITTVTVGALEV